MWKTHRLSYKFTHPDEDISDKKICHECDNPKCCNPDHLFSGTQQDNIDDRDVKGNSIKKLSHNEVLEMIDVYYSSKISMRKLSKRYGICHQFLSKILAGKQRTKNIERFDLHGVTLD